MEIVKNVMYFKNVFYNTKTVVFILVKGKGAKQLETQKTKRGIEMYSGSEMRPGNKEDKLIRSFHGSFEIREIKTEYVLCIINIKIILENINKKKQEFGSGVIGCF